MVRFDLSPALVTCACERAAKRAAAMLIACDCAGHGPSAIVLAIDLLPVLADRDGFAVDPPPVIRPACPRLHSGHSRSPACLLWCLVTELARLRHPPHEFACSVGGGLILGKFAEGIWV